MMNRDPEQTCSIVISMQVQSIVQQLLEVVCPACIGFGGHHWPASVLGALRGRRLTVTCKPSDGLPGGTSQKHAIKRADRLIISAPSWTAGQALSGPVSATHWGAHPPGVAGGLVGPPRKRHYLLRASVAVNGRSATVYEEVHTLASPAHAPGVSATVAGCAAGRLPAYDRHGWLSHALVSAGRGVG